MMELMPSPKITDKFNFLKDNKDKKSLLKTIGKVTHRLFGIFLIVQFVSISLLGKDLKIFEFKHANATSASANFINYDPSLKFEELYKKANLALISGSGQDTQNILNYLTTSLDNPDKKKTI